MTVHRRARTGWAFNADLSGCALKAEDLTEQTNRVRLEVACAER